VIPADLASCSGLQIIALRTNNLEGGIPAFLLNSLLIQKIDLRTNNLSGHSSLANELLCQLRVSGSDRK
jgi:hypothetical protein